MTAARALRLAPLAEAVSLGLSDWKFLSIEIGDTKQSAFFPQHKISYWNNECNVAMRLLANSSALASITTQGNLTTWRQGPIAISWEVNGRSLDQKIYLAERPENNQVRFSLNSKGIVFHYQPHECDGERPENVKGSYALYHATKANCAIAPTAYRALQSYFGTFQVSPADLTQEVCEQFQIKNYETGKVDHWYRRNIVDAQGVTHLCDMDITDGVLTYLIPDEVVYPAVID
jgi:hypothetical protein